MRIDRERGKSVCAENLRSFCSERATVQYVNMFESLCDMYELTEPDYRQTVGTIFRKLHSQIPVEEQTLLLMRVMELVHEAESSGLVAHSPEYIETIVRQAVETIGLTHETCVDVQHFLSFNPSETENGNVAVGGVDGIEGKFVVMLFRQHNLTLVSYDGPETLTLGEIPMRRRHYMLWSRNGIIKSDAGVPLYYTPFVERLFGSAKRDTLDFTFEGRKLDFRFPNSDNGLHNFTFNLHSGQLVAVMGGSGVGKSTLFNILNGAMKPDSGAVLINGEPLEWHKDLIGFVPQDDLLIEELTVWENLMFTARFCFGDESDERLAERVTACLTDLDLLEFADLKVGSPLNKTISGGQRKRLNIALELIRQPAILFLDEPTSGLSSADSEKVILLLKQQTYAGRLVLTNIHQPSSDIYKLFDHLWMLDRGGYPIYNGNPIEAITYFKTAAHKPDAESAVCQSCGTVNPEVMMEIIDAKALDANGRVTNARKVSPQEWHEAYLEMEKSEVGGAEEAATQQTDAGKPDKKPATASPLRQFGIYLYRTVKCKLANRQFVFIALLEAPLLAAVVAFLTRYSGENGYSLMHNHNLTSYYFMAIIVATFMGMSLTAEEIFRDKALLKREKFLHLSFRSYISSKITFTACITALQSLLFVVVGNALLGITDLFMVWWAVLFTSAFLAGLTGLFLSRTLKSVVAIYITIPVLLIPQILLCGVVVPFGDLNSHSKTGNVPLIGDLIPSRWAFEALAVTTFTDNDYNKLFFDLQRGQYELQMFRDGYLGEMRSVAQQYQFHKSRGDKSYDYATAEALLKTQSDYICGMFEIEKPGESIQDYAEWIERAADELHVRSIRWTRALDKLKQQYINEHGQQALNDLQREHTNKQLEQTLTGQNATKFVRVEGDAIVPLMGMVYLDPKTRYGSAPFYSHVKLLGELRVPTLWYNLAVMWVMCVVASLFLYRKFDN